MSTTNKQNSAFWDNLKGHDQPLDAAIEWIADNVSPENVFTEDDLRKWAEGRGVEHVFHREIIQKHCQSEFEPDDLFTVKQLKEWALSYGFAIE